MEESNDDRSETSRLALKLVTRIYRGFAKLADPGLRDLGLALGQVPVLSALREQGPSHQAELARIAQVEQPSMAQLLARMERDGLITRTPDSIDSRSRRITLTDQAVGRIPKAQEVMKDVCKIALAGFAPDEVVKLVDMLRRIEHNLERP